MSTTYCDACLKRGQHSAICSVCYQCREFYCKTCSDMHPTFKSSEDHNIFKLLLPAITPSVNNEDECASDFLKTEYDDPPYAAQVTLGSRRDEGQSKRAALPRSDKKSTKHADPGNLKAVHCRDISVKRSEDKKDVGVNGVLTVAGKVVVVDNENKMLKLFDDSGTYLSSTALKDSTWGITHVSDDTFATSRLDKKVYLWNIHGQTVTCSEVTYHDNYYAYGIHYNQTYYCVLHRDDNVITILGRHGGHVRHITIRKACGKKITFGYDIYMDQKSHAIYVPCQDDSSEVLCMSVEGEVLWFTPLSGLLRGITEIRGVLCVADMSGCLHLLSKAEKYERELLEESYVNDKPEYIYYDGQGEKLYVSFYCYTNKRDVISVYSVT